MKIAGSKFVGHDSAICVIDTDKKDIFAISTERITRIKHDWASVLPVLKEYKNVFNNIDVLVHATETFTKPCISSLIKSYEYCRNLTKPKYVKDTNKSTIKKISIILKELFKQPKNTLLCILHGLLSNKLCPIVNVLSNEEIKKSIPKTTKKFGVNINKIVYMDHHLAHAASVLPFSNDNIYANKLILTVDGEGDGYFSKVFEFKNKKFIEISKSEIKVVKVKNNRFAASVGILYGNFTEAMDLQRDSDEGKVEALAAYGVADTQTLKELHDTYKITDLRIDFDTKKLQKFYDIDYLKVLRKRIGDKNFCATIQTWLEELAIEYTKKIKSRFPHYDTLHMVGGVAANVIMNLKIFEQSGFKNIIISPPMGDDGLALGSAIHYAIDNDIDISWIQNKYMPYYGHKITNEEINKELSVRKNDIVEEKVSDWIKDVAKNIYENKIVAIVQGKAEYGPRALGNRSILANPTDASVKDKINAQIKRRPWYQPFCPSILEEEREKLFEDSAPHKYMAIAYRIKKEFTDKLPSAMHIDNTARPQFVEEQDNPNYYKILKEFKKLSGYGVVINTSFNLHGRTMVRTAKDAFDDFVDCNLDALYINGRKFVRKTSTQK